MINLDKIEDVKNHILTMQGKNFDDLINFTFNIQGWNFEPLANKIIENKKCNVHIWETVFHNTNLQESFRVVSTVKLITKQDTFIIKSIDTIEKY